MLAGCFAGSLRFFVALSRSTGVLVTGETGCIGVVEIEIDGFLLGGTGGGAIGGTRCVGTVSIDTVFDGLTLSLIRPAEAIERGKRGLAGIEPITD